MIHVNGTLYGTRYSGGTPGAGTVFSITTSGKEKVLHSFGSGNDGTSPQADLFYHDGALYGTTYSGGANDNGSVLKTTLSGKEPLFTASRASRRTAQPREEGSFFTRARSTARPTRAESVVPATGRSSNLRRRARKPFFIRSLVILTVTSLRVTL